MLKEIARLTLFLRTSPLQADCEFKIAGCTQKIMDMPKLFCGPLLVVCGIKTLHIRLACALRIGQYLPVNSTKKHVRWDARLALHQARYLFTTYIHVRLIILVIVNKS
jgi:hypothetical protein